METGPRVEGSSIGRLQTHGKQKVWALVQQSAEGTSAPHALLISSDAGRSWDLVSLSSLGFQTGLEDPDIFHFFDADHGLLSVKPPSGKGKVWQTSDGGRSWHLVWETRVDPDFDGPFLYPRDPDPLHATLFTTMQYGYDKATSLVRLWEDPVRPFDPYVIQRFTDVSRERTDERNWEKVGTIPRNYIVRNGRLQPD
jgi:hypothetical protein